VGDPDRLGLPSLDSALLGRTHDHLSVREPVQAGVLVVDAQQGLTAGGARDPERHDHPSGKVTTCKTSQRGVVTPE
jgi:hypothetical protein